MITVDIAVHILFENAGSFCDRLVKYTFSVCAKRVEENDAQAIFAYDLYFPFGDKVVRKIFRTPKYDMTGSWVAVRLF